MSLFIKEIIEKEDWNKEEVCEAIISKIKQEFPDVYLIEEGSKKNGWDLLLIRSVERDIEIKLGAQFKRIEPRKIQQVFAIYCIPRHQTFSPQQKEALELLPFHMHLVVDNPGQVLKRLKEEL